MLPQRKHSERRILLLDHGCDRGLRSVCSGLGDIISNIYIKQDIYEWWIWIRVVSLAEMSCLLIKRFIFNERMTAPSPGGVLQQWSVVIIIIIIIVKEVCLSVAGTLHVLPSGIHRTLFCSCSTTAMIWEHVLDRLPAWTTPASEQQQHNHTPTRRRHTCVTV